MTHKEYMEFIKQEKEREKKRQDQYGKCEACNNFHVQWSLIDSYHNYTYKVCSNCLLFLVAKGLTKEQFKNLLQNGHEDNEFLLHEDFYDKEGNAIQPKF